MLGDIHIAEPGALIGFSGRRVIEQTIREKLPEDFQKAEFQFDHGMIDMIVHRHQLKETLARTIRILTHKPKPARSEAHTSELQSLMRPSYAVVCMKQNTQIQP